VGLFIQATNVVSIVYRQPGSVRQRGKTSGPGWYTDTTLYKQTVRNGRVARPGGFCDCFYSTLPTRYSTRRSSCSRHGRPTNLFFLRNGFHDATTSRLTALPLIKSDERTI